MNLRKTIFVIATILLGLPAWGDNGDFKGTGGDSRCVDFNKRMLNNAIEIKKYEAVLKNELDIDFSGLVKIATTNECIPVKELDREARSFPNSNTTKLLADKYEKLTQTKKTELVMHELMVLKNIETEGRYTVTNKLIEILIEKSRDFRLEMIYADKKIKNSDGTVTLIYPAIESNGNIHYIVLPDSMPIRVYTREPKSLNYCMVFGLNPTNRYHGYIYNSGRWATATVSETGGTILSLFSDGNKNDFILSSITCEY